MTLTLGSAALRASMRRKRTGCAPGGVGAGDQEGVAEVDVFVADGRGVGTERGFVTGDGGGHAEAGVGVDVVRAEEAFDEFCWQGSIPR